MDSASERVEQGDLVEFTLKEERGGGREAAGRKLVRRVVMLERGGGLPQERGVVLALKEENGKAKFGFIRCEASEAQLFFHVSELERGLTPQDGCEVRFVRRADPTLPSYHPSRCASCVAPTHERRRTRPLASCSCPKAPCSSSR